MFKEYTPNIQAVIPNNIINPYKATDMSDYHTKYDSINGLNLNQKVQFLKQTVLPSGKITYKESMGTILKLSDEYAEIIDSLGDIIQTRLNNIKSLSTQNNDALLNISSI